MIRRIQENETSTSELARGRFIVSIIGACRKYQIFLDEFHGFQHDNDETDDDETDYEEA